MTLPLAQLVSFSIMGMYMIWCRLQWDTLLLLMLTAAKSFWQFWWNLAGKCIVRKIFDGEMLIETSLTTLHKLFSKMLLSSKVIAISITDPDDNLWRNILSINELKQLCPQCFRTLVSVNVESLLSSLFRHVHEFLLTNSWIFSLDTLRKIIKIHFAGELLFVKSLLHWRFTSPKKLSQRSINVSNPLSFWWYYMRRPQNEMSPLFNEYPWEW